MRHPRPRTLLLIAFLLAVFPSANSYAVSSYKTTSTSTRSEELFLPSGTVLLGKDGNLYLLSQTTSRILRWNIAQHSYVDPILLNSSPSFLAYSNKTNRLYVGYKNKISQIKLDDTFQEQDFVLVTQELLGLVTAGEVVISIEKPLGSLGGSSDISFYDSAGNRISKWESTNYIAEFTWNEATQRIYFFYDNNISAPRPDTFYVYQLDQNKIFSFMTGRYYEDGEINHPIRVAPDGSAVIVGTGSIFDGTQLNLISKLPTPLSDADWLNGRLYTLRSIGEDSQIQAWDRYEEPSASVQLVGSPVRLFQANNTLAVVTDFYDNFLFWILDPELNWVYQSSFSKTYLPSLNKTISGDISIGSHPCPNCCAHYQLTLDGQVNRITSCIPSVDVHSDGWLQFNVTWSLETDGGRCLNQHSDANNPNMYITDNQGNRYDSIQVGGAAATGDSLCTNRPTSGWFLFPAAKPGATTFSFHDDDQHITIDNIRLIP